MDDMQVIPPGTVVYGADGESIGSVMSADDVYMTVDTGGDPARLFIPASAIFETREDGVYLSASSSDAQQRGWEREPEKETVPLAEADESRYSAVEGQDSWDERFATLPGPEDLLEGDEPAE